MAVKLLAGRYELIEKIGDGGMAVVYKARDRLLNRYIAIKILKPEFAKDQRVVDSFRREAQSAAALAHPNIVSIFDVGREGNIHFIVMELIEGETLATMIDNIGPMDYHDVIDITRQIAQGLSYAHKNNIIHRDIKPHNILITPDGVAKIADFGIAKALTESNTMKQTEEMVMGSVHYFSPEQARGSYVDAKSDIYSLGIVMYEMLTGRVPFDADTPVQVALMHINDEMIPPSYFVETIPPRLEAIVMKCTNKVQVNRYRDADEIIRELDKIEMVRRVVGENMIAPEANRVHAPEREEMPVERKPVKKQNKGSNKKKIAIIAASIVGLAVVIGLIVFFMRGGSEVTVPDVKGMTYEDAEAELQKVELDIKKGNEVFSDEYEEGEIVSQDPDADTKVKKGKKVTVNISKGSGTETVPDVIGSSVNEARSILEAKGFEVGSVKEEESSQTPGTVIRQDPTSGYEADTGSLVNLVVAKKPEIKEVTVPGLLGKTAASAEQALNNAGLQLGNIKYEYSNDYPEGQVMKQQHNSGTKLDENSSVDVVVSRGPEPSDEPEPEPVEPSEDDTES